MKLLYIKDFTMPLGALSNTPVSLGKQTKRCISICTKTLKAHSVSKPLQYLWTPLYGSFMNNPNFCRRWAKCAYVWMYACTKPLYIRALWSKPHIYRKHEANRLLSEQYYAYVLCLWQPCLLILIYDHLNISFSWFMPLTFEIVCTCVSIQNTNAHEVLGDSYKYFTFVSLICSFTSITLTYSLFGNHICFLQILMQFFFL